MEKRYAKLVSTKGGSGSTTFRATLPSTWVRKMELNEDTRKIILSFDGEKIIIENNKEENKVKTFEDLNELNSTIIEVDAVKLYGESSKNMGKVTLKTTEDPTISDDGNTYVAPAIDIFGNEVELIWEVKDNNITDESEICDWNNPIEIKTRE